ncbi:MAG: DUF4830 domain-containing protein [Oscillospiraceae bacterium]|nr:DUF4830 domain-containing protein [Oscillospiraceae bacterium]
MFVYTAKFSRKKLVIGLISVVVIAAVILIIAGVFGQSDKDSVSAVSSLRSNEDRVGYLSALGWQVEEEPVETVSVRIPEKFESVLQDYNSLQRSQGNDLEKYAGKLCTRYTYKVTNYPTGDESVVADLIVYRGKVIAGDVQSVAIGGFMQGLEYPKG